MKLISVELYTRIARFSHESCPVFIDRRAGAENAREETTVTRRNRRCHESRPCSQLPTPGGNTVRVRLRAATSNPLIMNRNRRVATYFALVAIRDDFSRHARATPICEPSYPVAVHRTRSKLWHSLHRDASGVENQRLRRRDRACSWSMSDGGFVAGERGGSEPPRRVSGGACGHCRSTACRARCRRACRERRRPGRARRARRPRRIGDTANDRRRVGDRGRDARACSREPERGA